MTNDWDWRKCPHLVPDLSYDFRAHSICSPYEKSEHCIHYDGCSLSLINPPNNSCNYATCYGRENTVECGTHKLLRLDGIEKPVALKESTVPMTQPYEDEDIPVHPDSGPIIDDVDATIEEEDALIDKVA